MRKHVSCLDEVYPTEFDELLRLGYGVSHLISTLYNSLLCKTLPNTDGIRSQWEHEIRGR